MINGTWLWYEWGSLFVLLLAITIASMSTWFILHEKGHKILGAMGLVTWVYLGTFAMVIMIK